MWCIHSVAATHVALGTSARFLCLQLHITVTQQPLLTELRRVGVLLNMRFRVFDVVRQSAEASGFCRNKQNETTCSL